jgi:hypothetical protein
VAYLACTVYEKMQRASSLSIKRREDHVIGVRGSVRIRFAGGFKLAFSSEPRPRRNSQTCLGEGSRD